MWWFASKVRSQIMAGGADTLYHAVAGYVAVTGQELNLPDVYDIPADRPYQFNRSFDDQMGYRSRSVLALPMRDHRDRVVGALQFWNKLKDGSSEVVPFGEEIAEILRAIASQSCRSHAAMPRSAPHGYRFRTASDFCTVPSHCLAERTTAQPLFQPP